MAVARIKKAELYIHKADLDDVLSALQKTGSYEVVPVSSESSPEEAAPVHPDYSRVEGLLGETRFLLRFLEPHFKDTISPLARALGERETISLKDGEALEACTDIMELSENVRGLERRLMEIRSELTQIGSTEKLLNDLSDFPYPFELITSGTERIRGVLGTMPASKISDWKEEAESLISTMGEIYVSRIEEKAQEGWIAVLYDESLNQSITDLLARYSFSRVDIPHFLKGARNDELHALSERKSFLVKEEERILHEIADTAQKWVPTVRILSDYWTITRDRYLAMASGYSTEQVIMLRGWIPEASVPEVTRAIAPFGTSVELFLFAPRPEDSPPSHIVNSSWCLPFENLTRLYGAPKYGEIDPTPLLAPFFFIFFGMCLGDAGYGLILIGFFTWFLRKFKKMPKGFKGFFKLFVLSGISTVVVGALTGSWFGDLVDAFAIFSVLRPVKNLFMILNPMENPMVFLAISLALGVVQIFFGLFVAFFDAFRKGNYMGAFADTGGWILFLAGLLLWGGVSSDMLSTHAAFLAKTLTLVGAVVLVATQGREKKGIAGKAVSGLLSLYNVTSYLGDALSYSRLLALGLATSAVGMIINMLAGLAGGVPYIGWIFTLVLLLGGHIFSIAVNVLGAFVHSLRLQYVEFFSKFYTGGGSIFSPLTYKTTFVSIKSDSEE